jgi:hypothetical protein
MITGSTEQTSHPINCASKNAALSCLKWQEIILSPNKENILDMVWKCPPTWRHERPLLLRFDWFMVFINTSVISWRSVLLMEETGVPGENHLPVASHWQTLSHYPNKELLQVVKYRYKEPDILHIGETLLQCFFYLYNPSHRGCAGDRIGTRFLCPRGTNPLKGVNPVGTQGYRNGTERFFGLKGRPSVVRDA